MFKRKKKEEKNKVTIGTASIQEVADFMTAYEKFNNVSLIYFCDCALRRYEERLNNMKYNYNFCFHSDFTFDFRQWIGRDGVHLSYYEIETLLKGNSKTKEIIEDYERLNQLFRNTRYKQNNQFFQITIELSEKHSTYKFNALAPYKNLEYIYFMKLNADNLKKMATNPMFKKKPVEIINFEAYCEMNKILQKYFTEQKKLFDEEDKLFSIYKYRTLEDIDLSEINFDDRNIAGINISKNIGNISINFDKIQKDLRDANLEGYDFKGYILKDFDLINTNLRNTNAGVDLLSCKVNDETKMSSGTQFDHTIQFYLGNRKISREEAKQFVKIKED